MRSERFSKGILLYARACASARYAFGEFYGRAKSGIHADAASSFFLRFLNWMLFFAVGIINNSKKNKPKNTQKDKYGVEHINSLHCQSSLSKYIPNKKKSTDTVSPIMPNHSGNFPEDATGPNTSKAKTNLLISNRCLEILRCCRGVSFTTKEYNRILNGSQVFV